MYKEVAGDNNIHDFVESREWLAFPGRKKIGMLGTRGTWIIYKIGHKM